MPANIPVRDGNEEAMDGPFPFATVELATGCVIQVRPTVAYEIEQWVADRGLSAFSGHDVAGARIVLTSPRSIVGIYYKTREVYEAGLAFDRGINEVTRDWKKEHPALWGTDETED